MSNKEIIPIIIVGAGPAGMTAAIYLARANANFKIFDKGAPGGKMNITQLVDNYPGAKNIAGPELSFQMFEQVRELGVEFEQAEVHFISKEENLFRVETDEGNFYSEVVIVATGTQERRLKIPGEVKYTGRGVSYCAICDATLYKEDAIAIIGGGNAAIEEAVFVAKIVKKLYVIHRREEFRADAALIDELRTFPNVEFVLNAVPTEIYGDDYGVTGLGIKSLVNDEVTLLDVKACFPFVGSDASTDFLSSFDVRDERGFVVVNEEMMTAVPGLFSVGDVNKKVLRQIVTATNDGAIAALSANRFVKRPRK